MKIGYARSVDRESMLSQVQILEDNKCEKIYTESVINKSSKRTKFENMINSLKPGDIMVVTTLDRIVRNMAHLVQFLELLQSKECQLISVNEPLFNTFMEQEKAFEFIKILYNACYINSLELTISGRQNAKENGVTLGRKPGVTDKYKGKAPEMERLMQEEHKTISDLARMFNTSRTQIYNTLRLLKK